MAKRQLNKLYYGKNTLSLIGELLHLIVILIVTSVIALFCWFIWLFTYERNTKGRTTVRKVRRIRALTNLKLWFYKHFKPLAEFIRMDGYLNKIDKKF